MKEDHAFGERVAWLLIPVCPRDAASLRRRAACISHCRAAKAPWLQICVFGPEAHPRIDPVHAFEDGTHHLSGSPEWRPGDGCSGYRRDTSILDATSAKILRIEVAQGVA
jgi:hypothetical protein